MSPLGQLLFSTVVELAVGDVLMCFYLWSRFSTT
jgi:hypothetical protein